MPANQPHRAEVSKLLVHPEYRRRGLARRMMLELEGRAGKFRKTLLTLDTRTGDAAEPLYASLGFQTTGIIPGYCLDPDATGRLDATTIMYKQLQSHTSASDR
jgi:ribosomal protein S18 acetylase RimI-like enzyme